MSALPVSAAELIHEWRMWMEAEGLSDRTIESRLEILTHFDRLGLDLVGADGRAVASFLARRRNGWAASTRANYYRTLKAWYRWLARRRYRPDNPMDELRAPKVPRGVPRPVTPGQLEQALRTVNRRRTRTMLLLAAYEGLRVHEIAKVRGEDFTGGRLRVVGKGGVEAFLPVHPLVEEERAHYPRRGWWFPSYATPDQPVTSQNVSTVLGDLLRRAGVDASAHQLRHFYGTEVLRSSGNLRVAQELLRHADAKATAIYTQVDDLDRQVAVLALPAAGSLPRLGVVPVVAEWARWMRAEGYSDRTIRARVDTVSRFLRDGLDVLDASADDIEAFFARHSWQPRTRDDYLKDLRAWYSWLVQAEKRPDNPTLPSVGQPDAVPEGARLGL